MLRGSNYIENVLCRAALAIVRHKHGPNCLPGTDRRRAGSACAITDAEDALRTYLEREPQPRDNNLLLLALVILDVAGGRTHRDARPGSTGHQQHAGTIRAASVDYDPSEVRAWARARGLDYPGRGRYLPTDLVRQWRQDQTPRGTPTSPRDIRAAAPTRLTTPSREKVTTPMAIQDDILAELASRPTENLTEHDLAQALGISVAQTRTHLAQLRDDQVQRAHFVIRHKA